MLNRLFLCVPLAALMCFAAALASEENAEKGDKQAKQVLEQFRKSLLAKDVDGLMKIADVPFYFRTEQKTQVFQNRDKLKQQIQESIGGASEDVHLEINELLTYKKLLEKYGDRVEDKERKLLDGVLKKQDRVLFLDAKTPEAEQPDRWVLLIRFRNGKAKLAGFRN